MLLFCVVVLFCCVVVIVCCCFVLLCVVVCCCAQPQKTQTLNLAWESGPALRGPTCSGFGVVVVVVVAGLDFPGPPSAGPPLHDPPPPDRPKFRSFCVSLGVFSLNFGGVLERRSPSMCAFRVLGLSCETSGPTRPGRRGSHTTARELQTCTFQGPCASNTTKIPREDPQRDTMRRKRWREREKKSAKFWAPHPRGPTLRGPTLRGPTLRGPTIRGPTLRGTIFSRFGAPPFGAPPFGAPPFGAPPFGAPTLRGPIFSRFGAPPFGPPPLRGPHPSGPPPFGAPFFLGSGPHPSGPHPSGPHPSGPHPSGPPFSAQNCACSSMFCLFFRKIGKY